ncbi:hypothetical protein CPAST_c20060 [Clostridium pasteurianum DSM 525 = ATCC 6013]|uniref:DUF1292 domain-containing protein n=1 Tax=Clostridium pasteurianum DSM 525 = ATCC 6013 TaxID=1262449 RepID=A0A0H3J2C5_CLOPA|nr:DUF1292 domain-containing protein [Clostridium pasteurianum]AJA48076.1 hypothetical protein CPAST_c20060 [Clostridium pasteurianum DSM 525 = ATCC 6013]AJA52064.1 hypothetical protein CLPA_c20060 [Clostridium pasteurianum DSM 525 = ATCC 6013]AOZ75348.1 hypothetical protein AQ983_09730 [Clostridium pasteurianum DSM 525 = ATCC 6013]AOZ79143.1 hypothetical protein AQ984_09720 [Clostridium pasteurianum]ELP60771.1 hypothetical protein F502_04762 [Clostridium pasteurianum DSM 525 = ATCC 6013]
METNRLISVINQKGEKVDLEFIDSIKVDGNEYVIAGPKDSNEAYAYKSMIKNGETVYLSIGEGEEFRKVLQKYNQH